MSEESRKLQIGDWAVTNYGKTGQPIKVHIIDRGYFRCESGVRFRVIPILKNGGENTWYDANWFEPLK